jgi:hypothetical protein
MKCDDEYQVRRYLAEAEQSFSKNLEQAGSLTE